MPGLATEYMFRVVLWRVPFQNRLVHSRPLIADHSKQTRAVAARGENGREGCEISSLVEHTGLSLPLAVYKWRLSNW